jgi:hypothetical protein
MPDSKPEVAWPPDAGTARGGSGAAGGFHTGRIDSQTGQKEMKAGRKEMKAQKQGDENQAQGNEG